MTCSKRWMCCLVVAMALGLRGAEAPIHPELPEAQLFPAADLKFLRELTRDVVEQSRVKAGSRVGSAPTNTCGFTLIMPGGRGGYPAFWIRDFAMSLESGFITSEEMLQHLRLTARCQNGPGPRTLKHGLIIPPFAVPDHINFDGSAVFYPGTYSPGEDQGNGSYGILPPVDDHFEFVHIAYWLFKSAGKTDFLHETMNGMTILERLEAAFNAPTIDSRTGLVVTDDARRAVGFGFCDAIYFTGSMLFPSLLRYRAAGELAALGEAAGRHEKVADYRSAQERIARNLADTFSEPDRLHGWLMAATKVGRQPDVWGTLYALHLGVLKGPDADHAMQAVLDAVRDGSILREGAVRHVPTNYNALRLSAWVRTAGVPLNRYQNGAYWHTPTGWLIKTVQRQDPQLALRLFADYIHHLRKNDYRLGPGHDGPWECFGPNDYAQNGIYMTSVTLPWSLLAVQHAVSRAH
jgi:hypothetical protein